MRKCWEILFILTIALPIGSSYYSWLSVLENKYGITILDVLFSILLCMQLFKVKVSLRIKKSQIKNILLFLIILSTFFIALLKGYSIYGLSSLRDSFQYFMCIEFLLYSMIIEKNRVDIERIFYLANIGYIGYTIVTVLSSALFNMFGERIGASSFTLSIILVPFAVYDYLNSKNKKLSIIIIICFVINSIISQNRTAFILAIVATLIEFLLLMKKNVSKKIFTRIIVMVVIGCFSIIVLIVRNNSLINRIITGGGINTFAGRVNTFNFYVEVIKEHLSGLGFGYPMHFFTEGNYQLPAETFQVDNAMIVWGTKGGIVFLFAFMYLMLLPIIKLNIKQNIKNKIFIISYMLLLVGVSVMTSQIIQGRSTALFVWTIVGHFCKTSCQKREYIT